MAATLHEESIAGSEADIDGKTFAKDFAAVHAGVMKQIAEGVCQEMGIPKAIAPSVELVENL